jgi:hypothetical protein
MLMKLDSVVTKRFLDHRQILIRSERFSHLAQPALVLPRGYRFMGPEHQQTVTGVQIGRYLRLLEATLIEVEQQIALAFEPGVGGDQAAGHLAGWWWHHLIEQAARPLTGVGP